jgi:hypothetical protein
MKKILFLFALIITSCSSVKNHNQHLDDLITTKQLKKDVDFAYQKLQKMHPKLYWYISKENLDYKFDSLKNSITKPINSKEFYKKIAPIIATIKQGHTFVYPSVKQYTKSEDNAIIKFLIVMVL